MDRNSIESASFRAFIVALRKESVDRNIMTIIICIAPKVALRKASVDRNRSACPKKIGRLLSLSARRAWIEMLAHRLVDMSAAVALRKESVDRNITTIIICIAPKVALRKESVDRNTSFFLACLFDMPSLSARRAWIEICCPRRAVWLLARRSPQGERG